MTRVRAGARHYRSAVMRYLLRPPLSLKAKYAAFLIDLCHQSDLMQEVLERAAERLQSPRLSQVLLAHRREERGRMQLATSDLRRLGYLPEDIPARKTSAGDAALRAYATTLSYERPVAMLGVLLMFIGLAAEISTTILRLLIVGNIPREAMRWLKEREGADPLSFKEICDAIVHEVDDPTDQAQIIEAVEVSGELLALSAAGRPPLP